MILEIEDFHEKYRESIVGSGISKKNAWFHRESWRFPPPYQWRGYGFDANVEKLLSISIMMIWIDESRAGLKRAIFRAPDNSDFATRSRRNNFFIQPFFFETFDRLIVPRIKVNSIRTHGGEKWEEWREKKWFLFKKWFSEWLARGMWKKLNRWTTRGRLTGRP